jgi:hypothetical protein
MSKVVKPKETKKREKMKEKIKGRKFTSLAINHYLIL